MTGTWTPPGPHRPASVDRRRVADALPGYQLGTALGRGGFADVLSARHLNLERDVAVKVLDATGDGAYLRFRSEARLLAQLDHPHIVRVYDYVETDEFCLIIMELLSGGTLAQRQPLSREGSCALGLAVADALSYAHIRSRLHRDIKPGNILFTDDGLPKVSDFGIAKILEDSVAAASRIVGTPAYMAPEQFMGGYLKAATDVYALAVVIYELLSGKSPFDPDQPTQRFTESPPPLSSAVPSAVTTVVLRALAPKVAERYPTARAFALDLADAAVRGFGRGWLSRSGILIRVDDEVREAAQLSRRETG